MPVFQGSCKVTGAGPKQDAVLIRITDSGGRFADRWFTARPPAKKEMLATALSAMINGYTCWMEAVSDQEESEIDRIYALLH